MKLYIFFALLITVVIACGQRNFYKGLAKSDSSSSSSTDPDVQAVLDDINNGDWAAAEQALLKILASDPNNAAAKSALGNVYLKQAGLDTISFAQTVTSAASSGSAVNVPSLLGSLPDGNATNVAALAASVSAFNSIPDADLSSTQKLQKAMAQFSYAMVLTKQTMTNSDGTYDSTKADSTLTTSAADTILTNMSASASTIGSIGGTSNDSAAASISHTTSSIQSTSGSDSSEKLKSFISGQSAQSQGT